MGHRIYDLRQERSGIPSGIFLLALRWSVSYLQHLALLRRTGRGDGGSLLLLVSFPGCCSPKGRVISCRLAWWCSVCSPCHRSSRHRSVHSLETSVRNNMQLKTVYWLIAAFVISFFAVGIPHWQIPYAKVSLPSTLYGPGLLVVGVLAAIARAFGTARLLAVILAVGAAVPAPILVRVAVDTTKDPTSHNLWPFEFIIAAVLGALCSSAGALVGSLHVLLSRHKDTT